MIGRQAFGGAGGSEEEGFMVGLVYIAISWSARNLSVCESESNARVVVRYERGSVRYLKSVLANNKGRYGLRNGSGLILDR